ncbi:MAG TPA: cell division protein FtsQ/DivIB [Caulobacteraceae bacterium]|nr:cell division protein FtsQ/DivIB [Caulobacteraceae bacterium]
MPAVVRGGRRQSSNSAPKKTAKKRPPRGRAASGGVAAGKLRAVRGAGLPPGVTGAVALTVLVAGLGVTLFTGGRAEALGGAVGRAIDGRLAAVGFKLKRVHVQGASEHALPHVKAALGLTRDQPLAGMDLDALKARVEAVGWVKDAKVVRLLPDTLVVAVVERERLAVWQHQGRAVVIDADGEPIPEADPGRFADLPLVVGAGANEQAAAVLPFVRSRPRLMGRLEALIRVDERRWDLRLKDGSLIQLPAVGEDSALIQLDQLDQRARVLELGFARIDLRDPEMIAVRPRETRTVQAVAAAQVEG